MVRGKRKKKHSNAVGLIDLGLRHKDGEHTPRKKKKKQIRERKGKRSIFRVFLIKCLEDGKNVRIEETQSTCVENKLYD